MNGSKEREGGMGNGGGIIGWLGICAKLEPGIGGKGSACGGCVKLGTGGSAEFITCVVLAENVVLPYCWPFLFARAIVFVPSRI